MLTVRKSSDRGLGDHGWLKSRHTFSFADYHDPANMGFRDLRVINEDIIEGGSGFPTHGHRDMEIISYIIEGALEHQDSMGNKKGILPGEVQRMSAGTGVRHSEYNALADRSTHFLQIWIIPNKEGLQPGYGQKSFAKDLLERKLVLTASNTGRDGSISIAQDVDLYVSKLKQNDTVEFQMRPGRAVWIQMVDGRASVNGQEIAKGDGASTEEPQFLQIQAKEDCEFLLFDLV